MLMGKKVYLKPIEKEDLKKRVEWINDEEIQATLNYVYPTSYAKGEDWFSRNNTKTNRRDFSVFTVENEEYIGFCGLIKIEYPTMKAELYAVIGEKKYWRGGYGTETYKILTNFGFIELGLNKIYGYQLSHNAGAHKVFEKLGWKRDGFLRDDIFSHGKLVSRYIVSILRCDWQKSGVYKD